MLSASVPHGARAAAAQPFSAEDIELAASAMVEAVLVRGHQLVFGGHPAITPLVLSIASLLDCGGQVHIFQSEAYAAEVVSEVERLRVAEGARLTWTPAVADDIDKRGSLAVMRDEMIGSALDLAVFIGGMNGVEEEFDLMSQFHPDVPRVLFTSPGGAAAQLAERLRRSDPGETADAPVQRLVTGDIAVSGRGYGHLALRAMDLLEESRPPA